MFGVDIAIVNDVGMPWAQHMLEHNETSGHILGSLAKICQKTFVDFEHNGNIFKFTL
jgi:hypothetical protein